MADIKIDVSKYADQIYKNDDLTKNQRETMIKIINKTCDILFCIVTNNIIFKIRKPYRIIRFSIYVVFDKYYIIKRYDNFSEYKNYYFFNSLDTNLFEFKNDTYVVYKHYDSEFSNNLLIEYNNNQNDISSLTNKSIGKTIEQNIINKINEIVVDEENQYIILEIFKKYNISIDTDLNIDNILYFIFGFVPRAHNFTFID